MKISSCYKELANPIFGKPFPNILLPKQKFKGSFKVEFEKDFNNNSNKNLINCLFSISYI